jgi:hypothetical protein
MDLHGLLQRQFYLLYGKQVSGVITDLSLVNVFLDVCTHSIRTESTTCPNRILMETAVGEGYFTFPEYSFVILIYSFHVQPVAQ